MAIHAVDPRVGELLNLRRPFPGRLEFAARLALICAVTTLVVEIYQTPEPALTVYVFFFLNKPDRGTSLLLRRVRVALLSLLTAVGILASLVPFEDAVWRVASIT